MMIPDFYAQQQNALRSGLQLGGSLRQAQEAKEKEEREKVRMDREGQMLDLKMNQAEFDYKQSKQQALQRNVLSDAAFLLSMDEQDQNKLFPSLEKKYRENDTLKTQIQSLSKKPYKERMQDLYELMSVLRGNGEQTAALQERDRLLRDAQSEDENVKRSAMIALGLSPRATGSASQTIAELGTAEDIADVESTIAEGKKRAEKSIELELAPKIKTAVTTALNEANKVADIDKESRSNNKAFRVYETGIRNLEKALLGTDTGPISGRLPAFSANQQIADGAVAVMAPILKQMFRTSGEGTFTDKDQEMLLAMVPTRKSQPDAIKAQLESIDAIIKSKLSAPEKESEEELTESEIMAKYGL